MDTTFVILCDETYLPRAQRTIYDLRGVGEWHGDVVLLTVDFTAPPNFIDLYKITVQPIPHLDTSGLIAAFITHPLQAMEDNRHLGKLIQWDKLQVFNPWFKQ